MKSLKNLSLLILCTVLVGCNTIQSNLSKAPKLAKAVAITGTIYGKAKDPNVIPYLQFAVVVIQAQIAGSQYDPVVLSTALQSISINELRNPVVAQAIAAAVAVYTIYATEAVSGNLDKVTYLKPILLAIVEGINEGLATP